VINADPTDAATIDATDVNATAAVYGAICQSFSRNTDDADDGSRSNRNNGSVRHGSFLSSICSQ
jgi:hypothetical protein